MKIFLTKNKKNIIKGITLLVFVAIICNFINMPLIKVNADIASEPSIEVKINSATPNPASIGQEITISGIITPKPFEAEIKSPKKEIVLVLDVSGSMAQRDETTNNSSTKISELVNAANDFIDKMKNVPNLKIGIVVYSSEAIINPTLNHYNDSRHGYKYDVKESKSVDSRSSHIIPDYRSLQSDLLDASRSTDLKGIINGLEALGGTNTGEGLRKAEYMLENGDLEANKSIVFMSDGEPTFYSVETNYYNYYTSIDNRNPSYGGEGNSDDDWYCKKYAEKIGAIIAENKSNVFSIGYGLGDEDSDGNTTMRDIHQSMGGIEDNFFATDSGAIDGVFSSIADKIIENYTIDNLTMNMNFNSNDGFSLSIGGNTVKLDNIVYNRVENSEENGKYRYEAASVPFSFIIKGSKAGEYNNVFEESNATFSWDGTARNATINQNELTIGIEDDEIPNIQTTLESATPNPAKSGQEIEVKYKIDTQPFKYNANLTSGAIDEAVFVIDETSKMNDGQRYTNFRNGFNNSILDGSILGERNIKFNAVGYNDAVNFPNSDYYNALIGRKSEREKLRLVFQDQINIINSSNNRNIEDALDRANRLLQEKGEQGKNKAMILVTSGNANYDPNSNIIKTISKNGYKIISLDISNTDGSENSNLKTLHHLLAGTDEDYILAKADGGNYNTPEKNYANIIAEKLLKGSSVNTISIKGAKLNFDLGENFQAVENGGLSGTGQVRTISLPDINYTLVKDNTSDNYLWKQTEPQPLEITFKIKSKEGKTGKLEFADDSEGDSTSNLKNYISYNKFDSTEVKKHIETPIITIDSEVFPNINAEVINPPTQAGLSQELSLEYKINAENFDENIISNDSVNKDVVFALDISKSRKSNGKSWGQEATKVKYVKDALEYNLLNNSEVKNAKYGIVTYSQKVYDSFPTGSQLNLMEPKGLSEKIEDLQSTNSGASQIPVGEDAAKAMLTKYARTDSSKYIVIISSGHGAAKHQIEYNVSSGNESYNRIILNLSDIEPDEVEQEVKSIFNELKNAKVQSYTFKTKLKFHTGGKFSAVSGDGLNTISDSWYDVETPEFEVKYNLDENGYYIPETIPNIEFKAITNTTEDLEFGYSKNEIYSENKFPGAVSYTNLSNEPVFNRINPFKINDNLIVHGVYKSIKDGELILDTTGRPFANGSIVPMAASFKFYSSKTIQLNLDENIRMDGDVNIYKINSDGSLDEVATINNNNSTIYEKLIEGGLENGDNVLILYNAKLPGLLDEKRKERYTNAITVGNSDPVSATINTTDGELPDLF